MNRTTHMYLDIYVLAKWATVTKQNTVQKHKTRMFGPWGIMRYSTTSNETMRKHSPETSAVVPDGHGCTPGSSREHLSAETHQVGHVYIAYHVLFMS